MMKLSKRNYWSESFSPLLEVQFNLLSLNERQSALDKANFMATIVLTALYIEPKHRVGLVNC